MEQTTEKSLKPFRCMMCGHDWEEAVERGEDKERACPQCRSNSVRALRKV